LAERIEGQLRQQWCNLTNQLKAERRQLGAAQMPPVSRDKIKFEWNQLIDQAQNLFAKKD
jgi:hypothetical protein